MDKENNDLLDSIEASAENVKIIQKEVQKKRKKRSDTPLYFEIDDDDDTLSLKINLIRYINSKNLTYQDLFDFCIQKCNGNEKEGKSLAYNTKSSLEKKLDIRSDKIDLLCEFLNVDIVLVDKDEEK